MSYWKSILYVVLSFVSNNAFSQYTLDNALLKEDATAWYDQQVGLQHTLLQHGELATLTRKSSNSHAYYDKSTWTNTQITYGSQTFHNIPALYDIEEDALIITNNLGPSYAAFPLKLRKELVERFEMGDAHFIYIPESVGWHSGGFYKALYEGKTISLLSKVFKRLELKYGVLIYKESQHYFVKKDGEYYRLKRLSALLRLYPEHKKEIRQHKRALSLGKVDKSANEDKLARLVEYCENLK